MDHETKSALGPVRVARDLLVAVAGSDELSTALAERMVDVILNSEIVRAAMNVRELLQTRSPFALVRAVELAELMCEGSEAPSRARRS